MSLLEEVAKLKQCEKGDKFTLDLISNPPPPMGKTMMVASMVGYEIHCAKERGVELTLLTSDCI